MKQGLLALALVLLVAPLARADEPADAGEDAPYREGWHLGGPPGEHARVSLELWNPDLKKGTEFEFGRGRPRVGIITSTQLGDPKKEWVWGGGAEVAVDAFGWVSFDYWELAMTGYTGQLSFAHTVVETTFPEGDVVGSDIRQHYAHLRYGFEFNYRFPVAEGVFLDVAFSPVIGIGARHESLSVFSFLGPREDGSHFFAVTPFPGLRASVALHLPADFTLRVGTDADWLPEIPHAPFSFTRDPAMTQWSDARGFFAVRWLFLEGEVGYRFFKAASDGGRVREGDAKMRGVDFRVALCF